MRSYESMSFSVAGRMIRAMNRLIYDRADTKSSVLQAALVQYLTREGYWGNPDRCPECASDKLTRHDWSATCRECKHTWPAYTFSGEETNEK